VTKLTIIKYGKKKVVTVRSALNVQWWEYLKV